MIPKELLAALRTIEIHTARLANEQLSGTYTSSFKGQGLAFREVRPVPAGRRRPDHRLERVGAHERDLREGLRRRARDDRDARRRPLGERALRHAPRREGPRGLRGRGAPGVQRRSATTTASASSSPPTRIERIVPPKKGEKHVMRVVREILGFEPPAAPCQSEAGRVRSRGNDPERGRAAPRRGDGPRGALEALVRVSRRRSIAFIVSDFYDTGYERALALASAKHDVVPVVLVDPRDAELPDVGLATFEDLESGESRPRRHGRSDRCAPGTPASDERDRRDAARALPQARARRGGDRDRRLLRAAPARPVRPARAEDPAR